MPHSLFPPFAPLLSAIYMNRALRGLYSALGMPQQRGPRNVEAIIAEWDERRRQRTLRRSFFELRAHVARKRRLHSRLTELLRRDQLPFEMIPASGSMTPDAISADHDLTDGPGQWAAEELAADMDLLRRGLAQGADVQPLAPLNMRGPPLAELNADADDDTWLQDCYRHFGADGFRAFCRQVFREGVPPK